MTNTVRSAVPERAVLERIERPGSRPQDSARNPNRIPLRRLEDSVGTRHEPRRSRRHVSRLGAIACLLLCASSTRTQESRTQNAEGVSSEAPSVGIAGYLYDVEIRGPRLEVRDRRVEDPVVLRILETYPRVGSNAYDFEYIGLEPGRHDLMRYLRPVAAGATPAEPAAEGAGSTAEPLIVEVRSVLTEGSEAFGRSKPEQLRGLGGYRQFLWILGAVWVAGLAVFVILFTRRRRARRVETPPEEARPSLADRLRPRLQAAARRELPQHELAELERMLLTYWSRELGLGHLSSPEAHQRVRSDERAGPLIRQIEEWLHNPDPKVIAPPEDLLRHYENLAPDALEPTGSASASTVSAPH